MAAVLPYEILGIILNECADDCGALYSCILINKAWYSVAIQHLWANPFLLLHSKSFNRNRAKNLLITFIECFTDIHIVKGSYKLLRKRYRKTPAFDYSLYLKTISSPALATLVTVWLDTNIMEEVETIAVRIIYLAIQYCQQLRTIHLARLSTEAPWLHLNQLLVSIKSLPQLRRFTWRGDLCLEILDKFSNIAHNLEFLSINFERKNYYYLNEESNNSLHKLIESQHQLKAIEIHNVSTNMGSILDLLKSRSDSLESIYFGEVKFNSDHLLFKPVKLSQLKNITMNSCKILCENGLNSLAMAELPLLQQLIVEYCHIPCMAWERLLFYHGKKLIDINVSGQGMSEKKFEVISQTCHNLRHLSVYVYSNEQLLFIAHTMKSLPTLHCVKLIQCLFSNYNYTHLFDIFAKCHLPHLDHLILFCSCNYSANNNINNNNNGKNFEVDSLKEFLSKSSPPLKTLIIFGEDVTDEHLDVILDHLSDTIRVLRVDTNIDSVSDKCFERVKSVVKEFSTKRYSDYLQFRCNAEECKKRLI